IALEADGREIGDLAGRRGRRRRRRFRGGRGLLLLDSLTLHRVARVASIVEEELLARGNLGFRVGLCRFFGHCGRERDGKRHGCRREQHCETLVHGTTSLDGGHHWGARGLSQKRGPRGVVPRSTTE